MITISVIGILAAVSSALFTSFQSKAKSAEAKLLLSSIYTSQEIFYNAFNMYSNCLTDMGFVFPGANQSYYAVGFPTLTADIDPTVHQEAQKLGLPVSSCPRDLAPQEGETYFLANKGVGNSTVNNIGEFSAAVTSTSNNLDNGSPGNTENDIIEGIGRMVDADTTVYSAAAFGYINIDFVTPTTGSLWSINSSKLIRLHQKGY